jgi:RNA polymerase sigma factor (sigma-70 family)
MTQWTEAEQFLLDRVRQRDGDAWAQIVSRYQGRLLAFARGRGISTADAEDLVQDTFLRLLRGLEKYRGEASLETYLFVLLRNRTVEWLRVRRVHATLIGDEISEGARITSPPPGTASAYAVQIEQLDHDRAALAGAIGELVEEMRQKKNFRDLQLAEMVFYAQMRNNAIAEKTGENEKNIGLLKHRWIKRLRAYIDVGADRDSGESPAGSTPESFLSEVWEEYRPSCPKRSTLGSYLLGTVDPQWQAYIDFHVRQLGCRFCNANLDDIRRETAAASPQFQARIMESSIGFFRRDR